MGGAQDPRTTVLVVEDDAMLRFGVCRALIAHGFDVLEADCRAAAARAFTKQPDVFVCDLCLPDGDAI